MIVDVFAHGTTNFSQIRCLAMPDDRHAMRRGIALHALLQVRPLSISEIEEISWGYLIATGEISEADLQAQ